MTMPRFLRSKRERALLWYAAEGHCQFCGMALSDDWHADHRLPWWFTHRTNVHEMDAFCAQCNYRKGGAMLRSFQADMRDILQRILSGEPCPRALFAAVTPGGGKTALVPLLSLLIPQIADKLLHVAPRKALVEQGAEAFENPLFRKLFGHTGHMRASGNQHDPTRGEVAYTTTYAAVEAAPWLHAKEFERHRYLLVLDEPHHLWRDGEQLGPWARAMQPLIDKAVLCLFMSGTFERPDQKPIAGLSYRPVTGNKFELDFPEEWLVRYRRTDALQEKAIVRLYFEGKQGAARWMTSTGEDVEATSFADEEVDVGMMLDVVLQTDYARHLLSDTAVHWQAHKQHWPRAKFLVVAPRIDVAKQYVSWLKSDHGIHAGIAHSHEPQAALEAIARFKQPKGLQALVTVAMAYEGLDVPDVTHLACLTRYRSKPWLEQCFARACRMQPGKQGGYIFSPDDPLMQEVITAIKLEQEEWAQETLPREAGGDLDGPRKPQGARDELDTGVIPLHSELTSTRVYDLEQELDAAELAAILLIQETCDLQGLSPLQLKRFAVKYGEHLADDDEREDEPLAEPERPGLPPHVIEQRLRMAIEKYGRRADSRYHGGNFGTINEEIIRRFGKKREPMYVEELRTVWAWLNERYPLQ